MTILDELDAWDSSPPGSTSPKTAQSGTLATLNGTTTKRGKARETVQSIGRPGAPSSSSTQKAAARSRIPASLLASYIDALPPTATGSSSAPLPSLSAYPKEELQEEVRVWGFRSSNDRTALMATLRRVWDALLERRSSAVLESTSDASEEEDLIISLAQQQEAAEDGMHILLSPSSSVTSDPSQDEELGSLPLPGQPVLLTPHHSAILRRSITQDEQLYQRILLMEPIPFEEIWSLVQRDLAAFLGAGAGRTPLDFVLAEAEAEEETVEEMSGSASDDSDVPLALGAAKRKSAASRSPTKKQKKARRKDSRKRKPLVSRDSSMQGIKGRLTEEVKAWLDLRGITWYEGDLVGPRTRHA
ncbi:hypothetical protein BCV69DRAFT_301778 [Microstroma glucosiphilum]|uniref:Uncharacterized protein n=1 Tax=Pseudomicrostroma glucosiphilum TaxID=1684307 RepID=A0A316TYF6_9BASI|nr:hypothetical protein BCV69DRAFT_301778 [Pseudomicrostroma glucosiphilum]PWN17754.1 hypothetical protein BCV69DRAFT_301778 [Pseudomicrostroma glucosiphilum]